MIKLKIVGGDEREKACGAEGENRAELVYSSKYVKGDRIVIDTDRAGRYLVVRLEDSMREAFIYVPDRSMAFFIPPEENRPNYSPKSFTGECHYIEARYADSEEIKAIKNLALNVYDEHENTTFYPHATANVETRGEAVFAARNAIDGMYANSSHGRYPYQSWGINRDPKAALTLDFGREVIVNEIRLTLRADYPHDNYWIRATVSFDDDTSEILELEKSEKPQSFMIKERKIKSLVLDKLIQAEGESPFPALTQIEVWGREANI